MRFLVVCLAASLLAACTYDAKPVAVTSAASEIQTNRISRERVSLYLAPDLMDLETEADTGYTCSAHKFPVKAGSAVATSVRKVVEEAFAGYELRETPTYSGPDLDMRVGLESFKVDLAFDSGFWSAKANAQAELVLKVDVSRNGEAIVGRTTIAGEGTGRRDGGCGDGAEASAEATEKAIKRTMENMVYKLVNSGALTDQGR
ncbi:hypothetical protein [Iodidimonas sp. SYSU 1G8]|jgi:hypothetical protein|uniref:hypothetical protein n=1 Tax=Iodidimonas sp. SYSU 1G8 TaxID=3133967 RepID=UPI0031FE89D9